MKKEKLGKILLEKKVARETMMRSLVDLKRTVSHLETEKGFLMKTNEELIICSSQNAEIEWNSKYRED